MLKGALTCALVLWATLPACADMYKYIDENGVVIFTDAPNNAEAQVVKKTPEPSGEEGYREIIDRKAEKYRVDPSLVRAIIKAESGFNKQAVSAKGAMGLMQLMPSTALDMGSANPFDPEDNIEAGVRYLSSLLEKFDGDLELALAAYNAGPRSVERYGAVPPIEETEKYIEKVFSLYQGKRYVPRAPKLRTTIYKVVLEDGTVLYTDSPFYANDPSRF